MVLVDKRRKISSLKYMDISLLTSGLLITVSDKNFKYQKSNKLTKRAQVKEGANKKKKEISKSRVAYSINI